MNRLTRRPLIILGALLLIAPVLAGFVLPLDPLTVDLTDRFGGPSAAHLLGTDQFGRDVLSRILVGARYSIGLTTLLVAICAVMGTAVGVLSAYSTGLFGVVIERLVDVLVSIPTIVVGLILAAVCSPGLFSVSAAVLIGGWTPFARVARNLTLAALSSGWVTTSITLGGSRRHVLIFSVLPAITRPLTAHVCLRFVSVLLALAGLSFLGLGVQPPIPEWGAMIADGRRFLNRDPALLAVPAAAVVAVAVAVGLLGQGLNTRARNTMSTPNGPDHPSPKETTHGLPH